MGGKLLLRLNIKWETDSEQVLRRKDEKNFEKRVKRLEVVEKKSGRRKYLIIKNGMLDFIPGARSSLKAYALVYNFFALFVYQKAKSG